MTKAELKVLERAFCCEIDGLMFQAKSKLVTSLAERGYLDPVEERIAVQPLGFMTCKGYALTHLGRLTYCMTC